MKKTSFLIFLSAICFFPALSYAQVSVAVLPFEGDEPVKKAETAFLQHLTRGGQLQAVSESSMQAVLEIHERAQLQGSGLHDISKLKLAEFLISGDLRNGSLTVNAIDVNTSIIVFTKTTLFSPAAGDAACRSLALACKEAILHGLSAADREPPDAAKPYLSVLGSLVSSLAAEDQSSFPYLAVYSKGEFIRPTEDNQAAANKAKQFLKYFRPYFIRSHLTFISMEKKAGNVLITCIVDKSGSRTKHIVGFVELDDGKIAVLDELHKVIK